MKVLLVTHVPCSAGTFISRFLSKYLAIPILCSEVNPYYAFQYESHIFSPCDPLKQAWYQGYLSFDDWINEFKRRISASLEYAADAGRQEVIIRDHLFSEYFLYESLGPPVMRKVLIQLGCEVVTVFSKRDPFDSFLGLKASFPAEGRFFDINKYAKCYRNALQRWKRADKEIIWLGIEDLNASHPALQKISSRLTKAEIAVSELNELRKNDIVISGGSGRYHEVPTKMKRRPFSNQLRTAALFSQQYKQLRLDLGYEDDSYELSKLSTIIVSLYNSALLYLSKRLPLIVETCEKYGIEKVAA